MNTLTRLPMEASIVEATVAIDDPQCMVILCTQSQRLRRWTTGMNVTTAATTPCLSYKERALCPASKRPSPITGLAPGPSRRSACPKLPRVLPQEMPGCHRCHLRWYRQKYATCTLSRASRFWCPIHPYTVSHQNSFDQPASIVVGPKIAIAQAAGESIIPE